jgi:hypothetical protein
LNPPAEISVNDEEVKPEPETSVDRGEYQLATSTSVDEGEFVDKALDFILDGPVEDSVGSLVNDLDSSSEATRLKGLDGLLYICTKTSLGRLEVFRAGATRALIKLVQTSVQTSNPACSKRAVSISYVSLVIFTQAFDMQVCIFHQIKLTCGIHCMFVQVRLLRALTSANGVDQEKGFDRENLQILLEVSSALDVLIPLMREEKLSKLRLLAAETVANLLVYKNVQIFYTVRLVALINPDLETVAL